MRGDENDTEDELSEAEDERLRLEAEEFREQCRRNWSDDEDPKS